MIKVTMFDLLLEINSYPFLGQKATRTSNCIYRSAIAEKQKGMQHYESLDKCLKDLVESECINKLDEYESTIKKYDEVWRGKFETQRKTLTT